MHKESYHVEFGDRRVEFEWDGTTLYRDGDPVSATLRQTGLDHFSLLYEGRSLSLTVEKQTNGEIRMRTRKGVHSMTVRDRRALMLAALGMENGRRGRQTALRAPMPGLIVKVLVKPGDAVSLGDGLVLLEAMKMENELRAPQDGIVGTVHVAPGAAVGKNELLIEFLGAESK